MVFVVGCAQKPEQSAAELLTSAKTALNANQTEPAVALLDQLLDRQPDHAEALLFRAQLARDAGDDPLALTLVRRIPQTPGPPAGTGKYLEGSLLLAQGDCRGAERCFRTAIEWHPNYRQPRVALVELLLTQLRGTEAREQLWDWRKRQRWTLTQYVQHQLALSDLARPADSRPTLRKYLTYQPDDRGCLLALIRDELTAGEFSLAINRLQAVLQDRSDDEELQGLLTEALVRAGTLDRAASSPGAALPSRPAPVARWRGAALLADAKSDWPTAAAAWWHVAQLSPDDRHASYRLAIALERLGRADAAQRQFQRTRQLEVMLDHVTHILAGDQRQSHLVAQMAGRIAELLLDLQRPEEAQLWLEYLAETAPNSPTGRALWKRLDAAGRSRLSEVPDTADLGPELLAAARNSGATPPTPTYSPATAGDALKGSAIRLVDQQASAQISFQHFNGPTEFKYLLESLGGGVAVLDYDNDGWPDLYLPQGCRIPFDPANLEHTDRLYRNRGDGAFQDVTQSAGIAENRYSQGVAAGDFDNDGDSDLVVANYGRNTFYANNGDGTFSDISAALESDGDHWSSSAAWGDFDHDGDLDLYVVNYVLHATKICRSPEGEVAACSPGNFDGEPDLFYVNLGDGSFQQVELAPSGLEAPEGKGLGIVVADLDDNGWPDIYVANDGTPHFLFRNTGDQQRLVPQFVECGLASGAAVSGDGRSQAGMGVAVADFNADQQLDLYLTTFFNDYNTLYMNSGGGIFTDHTARAGLVAPTMPLLGFGTQAIDFNLDGYPDLLVANGHIDDFRKSGVPWKMPIQLFENRQGRGWIVAGIEVGNDLQIPRLGRAVARLDWNRDGRPDAVVVSQDRPVSLLTNETATVGRSFSVRLVGVTGNRNGLHTRVWVETADHIQMQEFCGGDGYFATNEPLLMFGVGASDRIRRLKIVWPGGHEESWTDLPADQEWICREGEPPLKAVRPSGRVQPAESSELDRFPRM